MIDIQGKHLVNLGDTLLHKEEWMKIKAPNVLMLPIGGAVGHNTMNEKEALQAVGIIRPKLVIPCHYNCPFLWRKNANPADVTFLKMKLKSLVLNVLYCETVNQLMHEV